MRGVCRCTCMLILISHGAAASQISQFSHHVVFDKTSKPEAFGWLEDETAGLLQLASQHEPQKRQQHRCRQLISLWIVWKWVHVGTLLPSITLKSSLGVRWVKNLINSSVHRLYLASDLSANGHPSVISSLWNIGTQSFFSHQNVVEGNREGKTS